MKKLKELFTTRKMSWLFVIIFAVCTAVVTAVFNLIPALEDTSFTDIAVNLDCWILFAVFIIINCREWKEASLKTFVFFLVSQPLIYLIEIVFGNLDFYAALGYYKYWFIGTVLTLPGAFCAFQLKRKDWISVAALTVANVYLAYISVDYIYYGIQIFPRHLLSAAFCILLAFFMIYVVFDEKKFRLVCLGIFAAAFAVCLFIEKPEQGYEVTLPQGQWTYSIEDEAIVEVIRSDDGTFEIKALGLGSTFVMFTDENGEEHEYSVTITTGGMYCSEMTD